ncbi:MAG: AbgT family transporter [Tissierellia bacterium]|nr:AbgT family transporter [Tissierellia bacterium]
MKKKIKVPHTYIILLGIALIMCILTWIIPAGEFDTKEIGDRTVAIGGSFHYVERNPQNLWQFFTSVFEGLVQTANISLFIFIVGGAFHVINETETIKASISKLTKSLKDKEMLVVPIFLLVFAIAGSTIGLSEETIVFIPVGIILAKSLGFDAMIGMSMITLGAGIGFSAGFMNPFSTGVAQEIAELPFTSGIWYRAIVLVVLWIVTSIYMTNYARKIKKDNSNSYLWNDFKGSFEVNSEIKEVEEDEEFDFRKKLILFSILIAFIAIAIGASKLGWFINEIASVFLILCFVSGLIGGFSPSMIADKFIEGAKDMVFSALVVGFARSILVVMENGLIIATIINFLSNLISTLPKTIGALGMYIVQIILNFFIPSGSGQAAATMPIMTPLADSLDITRQTAVLAFQFGDGFTNSIIPTSGTLMAQLAIAKIPYNKYAKFVAKLMALWIIIGMIFVIIATLIEYGPY